MATPLWLPWAARPLVQKYGFTFSTAERSGYSRIVLHDLKGATPQMRWSVSRAEFLQPLSWLWQLRGTNSTNFFVSLNGCKVEMLASERKKTFSTNDLPDLSRVISQAQEQLSKIQKLCPRALIANSIVTKGDSEVRCSVMTWKNGNLEGDFTWRDNPATISLSGKLTTQPWVVIVRADPLSVSSRLQISTNTTGVYVTNSFRWEDRLVNLDAQFAQGNKIPQTANLSIQSFNLPQGWLGSFEYDDVRLGGEVAWTNAHFAGTFQAEGASSAKLHPSVNFVTDFSGDLQKVQLHRASLNGEGIAVALQKSAEFDYEGRWLSPSALKFDIDLSKLTKYGGKLAGLFEMQIVDGKPVGRFAASGASLQTKGWKVDAVEFNSGLNWPWLEGASVSLRAGPLQGKARADLNFSTKQLRDGAYELRTAQFTVSSNLQWSALISTGSISGSLTNLSHSGTMEITSLQTAALAPAHLTARWQGEQFSITNLTANLSNSLAVFDLANASVRLDTDRSVIALIPNLSLRVSNSVLFQLASPAQIQFHNRTNLSVAARFQLGSGGAELKSNLQWPQSGSIVLTSTNIALEVLQPLFSKTLPHIDSRRAEVELGWNNSPLEGRIALDASMPFGTNRLSSTLSAELNLNGANIRSLEVNDSHGGIAQAAGALPVTLHPVTSGRPWKISTNSSFGVRVQFSTNDLFWEQVTERKGFVLRAPRLDLRASGSAIAPSGSLRFSAADVRLSKTNNLPSVKSLLANVTFSEREITLSALTGTIEGEQFRLGGKWSVPPGVSQYSLRQLKGDIWTNTQARLKIGPAPLAPFARFFPNFLVPEGRWGLEAEVRRGARLFGRLELSDLSSRPLPPLAPMRDITTSLLLEDRTLSFEKFSGTLGGEPIHLSGQLHLPSALTVTGFPAMDLHLTGTNLPLARQPDLVLRGDLDLQITNAAGGNPLLRGSATLRDSYYLNEIKALIPGRLAKPQKRPPFFSIEQPPFNAWVLDLRVHGDHFLKIRSPLFRGVASAEMSLEGTLSEPFAFGEAIVNEGAVQFPFANVRVSQGLVSLTRDDPFRPKIFVTGSARSFGYDIKMEVTGNADEPLIQFTSTPTLSTEQVILMLTTGEIPQNEQLFSNQQRAGKLAMFLGKSLWSKFSGGEGGAERLTIKSGEEISEQGRQTYQVEYKLTDVWSLVGEYDRFGSINAGLKWKLYSR